MLDCLNMGIKNLAEPLKGFQGTQDERSEDYDNGYTCSLFVVNKLSGERSAQSCCALVSKRHASTTYEY